MERKHAKLIPSAQNLVFLSWPRRLVSYPSALSRSVLFCLSWWMNGVGGQLHIAHYYMLKLKLNASARRFPLSLSASVLGLGLCAGDWMQLKWIISPWNFFVSPSLIHPVPVSNQQQNYSKRRWQEVPVLLHNPCILCTLDYRRRSSLSLSKSSFCIDPFSSRRRILSFRSLGDPRMVIVSS